MKTKKCLQKKTYRLNRKEGCDMQTYDTDTHQNSSRAQIITACTIRVKTVDLIRFLNKIAKLKMNIDWFSSCLRRLKRWILVVT